MIKFVSDLAFENDEGNLNASLSVPIIFFTGEFVAQFKFTVLLMANGPLRITNSLFEPELYKSELDVEDAELKVKRQPQSVFLLSQEIKICFYSLSSYVTSFQQKKNGNGAKITVKVIHVFFSVEIDDMLHKVQSENTSAT